MNHLRPLAWILIFTGACSPSRESKDAALDSSVGAQDSGVLEIETRCVDEAGIYPGDAGTCQYGDGPRLSCPAGSRCDGNPCRNDYRYGSGGCACPGGALCTIVNCGNILCMEGCACLDIDLGTCFCPRWP